MRADILIPNICKSNLAGESFLLSDFEIVNTNRLILFATANFLSMLKESPNWFAMRLFKCVQNSFSNYRQSAQRKMARFFFVPIVCSNLRMSLRMFGKLLKLELKLNPSSIMVDFEEAAMNSLEKFIACVSGCILIYHIAFTGKFQQMD